MNYLSAMWLGRFISMVAVVLTVFVTACGHGETPPAKSVHRGVPKEAEPPDRQAEARDFGRRAAQAFFAGRLEELHHMFDEDLAQSMDPEALAEFQRHIIETYGALGDVVEEEVFERNGAMVYAASVLTTRSDEPVLFLTVWDPAWRIKEIRIMPHPRLGVG